MIEPWQYDWNMFIKYNNEDVILLRNIFNERAEKDVNAWYRDIRETVTNHINQRIYKKVSNELKKPSTLIEYYQSKLSVKNISLKSTLQ